MAYKINAYCEKGHMQTFVLNLEGRIEVHGCDTCRAVGVRDNIKTEKREQKRLLKEAKRRFKQVRTLGDMFDSEGKK